jgi:hypothetical protein
MVAALYSLREKKHAKTKIAIMNAFIERLKYSRFDDIPIREVYQDAEVAERTFFNYFSEKTDVVLYYVRLATLKMIWQAEKETPAGRYLPLISSFFSQMSEKWGSNNLTYQIISVLLAQSDKPKKVAISALERKLVFPYCKGIEEAPSVDLDEWLKECVILAKKNGELPAEAKVNDVVVSLLTIITGTLLTTRFSNNNNRGYHYTRQLQFLWRGLGAK